jgi:hypothetical protein
MGQVAPKAPKVECHSSKIAGVFLPNSVTGSRTSYFIFLLDLKQATSGTFPLTITGAELEPHWHGPTLSKP